MSRFGWAYVNSVLNITGAVARGPTGSLQFHSNDQALSGTQNLIFNTSDNSLILTGSMTVKGTLYATEYQTTIVSASVVYTSGSTKFGDDASDTHQFTGSIYGGVISGTTGQFTTITGSTITGSTIQFTTITGSTVTGTLGLFTYLTASYISGGVINYGTVTASQISNVDYIDFNTGLAAAPTFTTGRLFYNPDTLDLAYDTSITDVVLNIGQQALVKVKNTSGAQINRGKLVFISGGVGDNPLIYTASWNTDTTSARTVGMVMRDIADGNLGYVILNGVITKVDTAAYTGGTTLYLSSSGDYTNIRPTQPLHGVRIGEVVRSHATVGSIFINIQNGYELDELHDVLVTSPTQGNLLTYNSSSALWVNSNQLSGNYGITGSLSIINALTASTVSASILVVGDKTTTRSNLGLAIGTDVQAYDATLAALAGASTSADTYIYFTGVDTAAVGTVTSFARTLLDDTSNTTARTTLGLGTIATQNSNSVSITGGSINSTTIGATTQSTGKFTSLSASTTLDVIGNTTITGSLTTLGTTSGSIGKFTSISGSIVTGSSALFTSITASAISASGTESTFQFATFDNISITAGSINAVIGNTTPSTGQFTTLSASSTIRAGGAITGSSGLSIIGPTTLAGGAGQNVTISTALVVSGPNATFSNPITASGGIVVNNSSFSFGYLNVTSNHIMTTASCIIGVSASTTLTLTLPSSSQVNAGRYFIIKDEAGNSAINNITISCSLGSGDTIDNLSSSVINVNNGSYTIYRGGTNKYYIV